MEKDIWTTNKYVTELASDGGRPRILTLKTKNATEAISEVSANEDKAQALAKSYFPKKPETSQVPANHNYPQPLPDPEPVTEKQIH